MTPARLGRGACLDAEHLSEDLHRLLHLVERADRDAGMCLLERRKVTADADVFLRAAFPELARRPADVHEDEVALRVGRLEAAGLEPVDRERPRLGVAAGLLVEP